MSDENTTRYYDDEIDLFELLEVLWAEKYLILTAALLPLLSAWGILLASTPDYEVRIPYSILTAPLSAQVCENEQCPKNIVASRVESLSNGKWLSVDKGSALSLTTDAPRPITEYQYDLTELNRALRAEMLQEAETEAYVIENELTSESRQTEAVATSLLHARRIIYALKGESAPLVFGPISISESKRNFLMVIVGVALFGALLGSVFVLFQKTFRDRRMAAGKVSR